MEFINAFLVGGLICAIGQIIMELFNLTPGHITCLFVSAGTFLEFGDIYDKIVKFGGAGAMLPITSFGHSLADAAYNGAVKDGIIGLSANIFESTSNGIVVAIISAVIIGLIFKPRG